MAGIERDAEATEVAGATAASLRELEGHIAARTAELEEERARLAAVVEHVPAGLLIVANDGRVLTRNEHALHILRIGHSELGDLAAFATWKRWRADGTPYGSDDWPLARTMRTGERVTGERVEVARPDGTRIVLDVSCAPFFDAAGDTLGVVGIFYDVTTRERRERAEREFVTNAAHELQSPLAAIVSAIDVLQAGAKDTPQRDLFLAHLEREAERLARLVQSLLVLARAELAAEAPKGEVVALRPLLEDVASRLALAEGVALLVDAPADLAVVTNRQLLEQALTNVAGNAAKHTLRGRIELHAHADDGFVQIAVVDTGPGIPASERPRIFERFYRGDGRSAEGFGLGLAIVRASVDAIDGELELDSTVGAGTIVRVRLPLGASIVR